MSKKNSTTFINICNDSSDDEVVIGKNATFDDCVVGRNISSVTITNTGKGKSKQVTNINSGSGVMHVGNGNLNITKKKVSIAEGATIKNSVVAENIGNVNKRNFQKKTPTPVPSDSSSDTDSDTEYGGYVYDNKGVRWINDTRNMKFKGGIISSNHSDSNTVNFNK